MQIRFISESLKKNYNKKDLEQVCENESLTMPNKAIKPTSGNEKSPKETKIMA